ncbi:alpha/beta hydrolase [Aeromicrobium sp. NPDC092404]|uniref:alpha/beta fold hydrolase n=1 Tax=Aeromicrobium sp. NPDC092404 TaxID=3154976 RepID=UPI0034479CF9
MSHEVPTWFTDALSQSYDAAEIEVDGVRVAYRAWGKSGGPVAILVHGGAAHAGWWDHVAPHLTAGHRVIALDLSGHGDSGHRETYALEAWADEVMAVAAAESDLPPVLLGHSMGGFVVLTAAQRHGHAIRGAAAIDSPVREMSPEARAWVKRKHVPGHRVHPDRESILAHFRTLPADGASLPYVHRHLAVGSIREVPGGWTWKFDPHIFLRARMEPEDLAEAVCEIALIRGERGMATTDITDVVAERLGRDVPVTVIRDAGHHIMLDQPIALIAVLQTLLGQWRIA